MYELERRQRQSAEEEVQRVEGETAEIQQTVEQAIDFRRSKRANARDYLQQLEELELPEEEGPSK